MKLAVLGLGCWGLVLTKLLTDNFEEVYAWNRKEDLSKELVLKKRTTKPYMVEFDNKVVITDNLELAIKNADVILLVVATSAVRAVCKQLKDASIKDNQILVNASKGLEQGTLKRMSEVIKDELPNQTVAVLSGPTLAEEVLLGQPTAACIASFDPIISEKLQKMLNVKNRFRVYTNNDIKGVEFGGSLKNVIAIAAGFLDGMNFGDNSKGALLARGMAEIVRISVHLGADPSTLYGLSGMGDLIATCQSPLSRNNTVGRMLAQGKKIDDILSELGSVAEGVKTSKAICELADKIGIETPISKAIYKAVYSKENSKEIFLELMNRALKGEESFTKK